MPVYEYNGKRYNIPEAKAQELTARMPGAKLINEAPYYLANTTTQEAHKNPHIDMDVPEVNQTTFDSEIARQTAGNQLIGGVSIGQKQNIADVVGDMYANRELTLPDPTNAAQDQQGFWATGVGDTIEKLGTSAIRLIAGLGQAGKQSDLTMAPGEKIEGDTEKTSQALQGWFGAANTLSERGDRYGVMIDPETGETRKKTYADLWKEGKPLAAAGEALLTATESGLTSALAMVPGAGLPLVAISAAGQKYNELDSDPDAKNLPEWKKILNASLSGAIEGATERIGAKVDLKMFEPILEKMTEKTVKQILAKGGVNALIQTLTEGGEEVVSQLGGNVVDYATGVTDEYKPFEGVRDSFVYGAAGGAQFGGLTGAGTIYRAVEQHKANVETAKVKNTMRLWESINNKQSQALPALNNEKQQLEAELGDLTALSLEEVAGSPEATPELIEARRRYDIVNAEFEGVMENLKREVDNFIEPRVRAIQDVAVDGVITELNVGTEEMPDVVYLTKGDIAINEDGTIDPAGTAPILTVKNSDGKKRMIARKRIITAQQDDLNTTIESIRQQAYERLVQPVADKLEGKTHFHDGEHVEYVNAKGEAVAGTVTAKQNNTVTVVGIDGKKTETFTEDDLAQRLIGETIDDVKIRDVIQVNLNGQVYDADVTNIQDGIAELHIPSFPEAAGRFQDVTAAELRRMRVMPQMSGLEQAGESDKTTEETPTNDGNPAGEIQQNESELQDNESERQNKLAPVITEPSPEQQQEQFIASLPKTKDGEVDYEQIQDDDTFVAALQNEFADDASEIVEEYKKQAEKKLKDAGRIQDPVKRKRAQRKAQHSVDRFNSMYEKLNPRTQYEARVNDLEAGNNREREAKMGEYLSLRDYLLRNIATGKHKFRWNKNDTDKGLAGELFATKNQESERKKRISFLDNKGHSPESLAELIAESAGQGSEINPGWFTDASQIRDEIIDVLLSHDTPTSMIDAATELRKQPETYEEYMENFVDPAVIFENEANEASQDEMLRSLPRLERNIDISDVEIDTYFAEQIDEEEYNNYLNNINFEQNNKQDGTDQNRRTGTGSDQTDAGQVTGTEKAADDTGRDTGRIGSNQNEGSDNLPSEGEATVTGERSTQAGIEQPTAEGTRQEPGRPAERQTEGVGQINPSGNIAQNENIDQKQVNKKEKHFTFKQNSPMSYGRAMKILEKSYRYPDGKVMTRYEWIESLPHGLEVRTVKVAAKNDEGYREELWLNQTTITKTEQDYYEYLQQGGKTITDHLADEEKKAIEEEKRLIEERKVKEEEKRKQDDISQAKQDQNRKDTMAIALQSSRDEFIEIGTKNERDYVESFNNRRRKDSAYERDLAVANNNLEARKISAGKFYDMAKSIYTLDEAGNPVRKYNYKVGDKVVVTAWAKPVETVIQDVKGEGENAAYVVEKRDGIHNQHVHYDSIRPAEKITVTKEQYESFDTRGYSYAVVKDGKVVTSGSNPILAKEPMPIKRLLDNAGHYKGDLYIALTSEQPIDTSSTDDLIMGLTWQQILDKQQGKNINLANELKMPENAVLFPKYEQLYQNDLVGNDVPVDSPPIDIVQKAKEAVEKDRQVKLSKLQKEADEALRDFLDAFNDLNSDNLGIIENSAEKQAKMLVAGTKMVGAYAKLGIYKFADLVNGIAHRGIQITDDLLSAIKKAYGAFAAENDIDELDDMRTVRSFKLSDMKQEIESETNHIDKAPETVKKTKIKPANIMESGVNQLPLFKDEGEVSPTNNNDYEQKRGSKKANPGMGTAQQQEAGGLQRKGVGKSSIGDTRTDEAGSRGLSDLPENNQSGNVKNTRNNRSERGTDYAPSSPKSRFNANVAAINLMRKLVANETTAPTQKEIEILRKYSGWGGMGTYFNNPGPENTILREILDSEEYESAINSINSAYYTPAPVIDALWDVAVRLGFKGGNILESSAGIGSIIGLMPESISNTSNIEGVEIDPISGNILKLLYPDAKIHVQGFEETNIKNGSVDLAITNVPFITGFSVSDKIDKDLSKKFRDIHDYFIAKNIRKLRTGGIGIFITSSGTLDKSRKLREWITSDGKADVIGAFRLNNETFSGTSVTSDIIIVRKRTGSKPANNAIDVIDTVIVRAGEYKTGKIEWDNKRREYVEEVKSASLEYNKYFVEHPENMGGEMFIGFEKGETYRPTSVGLFPRRGVKQDEALNDWVDSFSEIEDINDVITQQEREAEQTSEKEGKLILNKDGELSISKRGEAIPLGINNNKVKGREKKEALADYNAINTALADVLEYQLRNQDDKGLKPLLDKLNKAYDSFVSKYGNLNKNTAISFLRNDVDFPAIAALEDYSEDVSDDGKRTPVIEKTAVFKGRVIGFKTEPDPKSIKDGVIASIYKFGTIDTKYISDKLHRPESEVREGILTDRIGFLDPSTGSIDVRYEYLSGNVREKLKLAIANNEGGEYQANIEELEKVIPMDIPAHLIEFSLGSSWIDPKLYKSFMQDKLGVDVSLYNAGGTWTMSDPSNRHNDKNKQAGVYSEVFQSTIYGDELIRAALNNRTISVTKTVKTYGGGSETITDKDASMACMNRISELKDEFKEWAREKMNADEALSETIMRTYNDKFNAIVPKNIDEMFLPEVFEGAASFIQLYTHQKKSVIRGTTEPLLLAHEVGTGKTFTLISTAMEMRRIGTAKKPMIVVQNATVGQFVSEAKKLYPNAKILSLTERDRTAEGRREFYGKIKYSDWDIIVVPQSTFEMIPDSPEREKTFIREKIEDKLHALEAMTDAGANFREIYEIEKELEDLENELAGVNDSKKKRDAKGTAKAINKAKVKAKEQLDRRSDDVQYFDDMGVDAILVDEAHAYKRLGFATAMTRGVKGIDPAGSKRAASVYLKTRAVLEKSGWKNVVFATGTPISNTAAEIWTFMKYLMKKEVMIENDIYYFDDFVRNFGNIAQSLEFTTAGKFKENTRFAAYINKPELIRLWASISDTVLTKEVDYVNDKVPDMEGGKAQDIYLRQSYSLVNIMKSVRKKLQNYEKLSGKEKKANSHIPLTMYGVAKRAAIDTRLVDKNAPDDPLSKTNRTIEEILKSLKETEAYKGTVAVFCDQQNRRENGVVTFDLFEDMKQKLISKGIPSSQIMVMESGMTITKKERIFADVNSGNIRVIIGNTATLGTGVNIQERLHTIIHMDAPDRPMDYTQRNGRILRQGNLHKIWGKPVRVLRFGVEDSLDVTSYQRLKTKASFIDSIMDGKAALADNQVNRVLEEEEEGLFDNPVAVLSGSQYALLKNKAERELRKLQSKKQQHEADQVYISNKLRRNAGIIKANKSIIENRADELKNILKYFPDGKADKITIAGKKVSNITEIESALKDLVNKPINEKVEAARKNIYHKSEIHPVKVTINGVDFTINTRISRESVYDEKAKASRIVMHREVSYESPMLKIGNTPIPGGYVKGALNDIIENVITGNDSREYIEALKRANKRMEEENASMNERKGKPFGMNEELDEARKKVDEYTELMKSELAEKEAKYAEVESADVEINDDIDEAASEDDEDPRFRSVDDIEAREAYAMREWSRAKKAINKLSEKMRLDVEILETTEGLPKAKAESKGWYDVNSKKITIVMPNHTNSWDAQATLLHEAVGHHGLRELFGEHFNTFLDNVYNNADEGIKTQIDKIAQGNGGNTRLATEEYISGLAEDQEILQSDRLQGFFNKVKRFFFEMLAKLGFNPGFKLSDNELKYILWRSYQNLAEPGRYRSIVGHAKDVAMQDRLKVGNYAERGTRANVAEEPVTTVINAAKHLESDGAQEYTELNENEVPENTQVAYKLMRYMPSKPGMLFPLYAKDDDAGRKGFKKGKWYKAEVQSVKIGGNDLANRPGIHAVNLPLFLQGKVNVKGETRVWAKVLMPAMNKETQAENDASPILSNGQREGIRGRLIGANEAYNFKTNPSATGADAWPIAGSMKIVEVISDKQVEQILRDNGKELFIDLSLTGDPDIRFRSSTSGTIYGTPVVSNKAKNEKLPATITIDGVERSTTNSDGKRIAPTREGVINFWRWFGDSKVVDEEGRPMVVYHGTKNIFDVFDESTNKYTGFYFTNDPELADSFSGGNDAVPYNGTGNIMPVYLRIENPVIKDFENDSWDGMEKAIKKVKASNRDGYIGKNVYDVEIIANQYVAFSPSQIKSATGNVGTFDPSNEDIRFHSGEKMSELDERLKSATRQGVKTETVRQIIDEIESVHTSEIEATVVNNKQELIDLLRMMNANEEMVAEAEDPDVPLKGVYFRGMIFINAGEMNSVDDVLKVWVHENFHAWMKKDPSKIVPLMGVFSEETLNSNLYKGYHKQSEAVKIEEILAFAIEKVYVGGPLTKKREIRDHLDPIIKQYLDYATEGEFSKRNPDFGRGRGRNADALLDNEGSGREGVAAARKGGSPYQQRQANEAVLPGDERVPGEEVKRADDLFDNIDNLKSVVKDYGGFLGKVFEGAPNRGDMLAYARENGFDKLGEGIEQYLADVEDPAELSRIKELLGVDMPDNALRYMLWRNANPDDGTVVWKAKEAVKTNELDDNILFRKGEAPSSIKENEYEMRVRSRHNRGFRSIMYGIEEGWFDRMASLRILQDAITGGKGVSDKANAYMLENQLTSRNTAEIRYYTKNIIEPFIEQIHTIFGRDMNAADMYLNAKHGIERNQNMAEEEAKRRYSKQTDKLLKELSDGDIEQSEYDEAIGAINEKIDTLAEKLFNEKDYSGLTAIAAEMGREDFMTVAREIVDEVEGRATKEDVDALWNRVNKSTKWTLEKQYNAGMMTRETYEKIRGMYNYYVPLRGFDELTATDIYEYLQNPPSDFNGTLKKAYGRTSKADSPTATIMNMGESGIMQANRNRMKQAFYRLVATNPSNYASIEDVWYVETADGFEERFPEISPDATADEVLAAIADFNNDMAELATDGKAFKGKNKLNVGVKIMKAQASEHVVRVWIAGEEKVIFINGNPRAAQAINGLTQNDLVKKSNVRHGIEYWSRQMAANFTSRNPAFMVTNLMRDLQFALISATVKEGGAYAGRLAKNVLIVGKTIKTNIFNEGNKDNPEFQKYWEEFLYNGGETGYANLHSVDHQRKYVNKKLREFSNQRDFLKLFRAYTEFMESSNRMVEDLSRFATYVTSRQEGRSIERSVSDAKEITLNFNRKGSGGALANFVHTFYLFANPAIQGLRLMGSLAKNHPVRFTAMLSSSMAAGAIVPMINELLINLFGDDDDKEKYRNITPWVRRNNITIFLPFTKEKFVTWMLPHEIRPFYGIGEMAYEAATGGMRRQNLFAESVKQMTTMLPIDPFSGADWWVPDFAKPVIQSYVTNRNFMDSPIYRDTQWNKFDPEWTKAYKGTPDALVEAAKWASEVSGGDDVMPGKININPARINNLLSGYMGGFLTTYTDLTNIAFNLLTGRNIRVNDIPVANKLIRTSDEQTEELRINSEYFYYLNWIKEYEHKFKGYEKRIENPEYAEKWSNMIPEKEQRMYQYAKSQTSLISDMNDYDEAEALRLKEEFVRTMWEYEDEG